MGGRQSWSLVLVLTMGSGAGGHEAHGNCHFPPPVARPRLAPLTLPTDITPAFKASQGVVAEVWGGR